MALKVTITSTADGNAFLSGVDGFQNELLSRLLAQARQELVWPWCDDR